MNSEVDTSILNSVNIKRFTHSVLEVHDATIDRSDNARWDVEFPDELAHELDRETGTLVFDPVDRDLGAGHLLVQPGTTVFSALLDLVQRSSTVGCLRLTDDELQVTPPTVLQESNLGIETIDFTQHTADEALTFHFRVQFETPSSFHNEEMFSVTIDPDTGMRLPDLTARLTSHLPQLLRDGNSHGSSNLSRMAVNDAFEDAQQAVIERAQPIAEELREEADESATDRINEISDYYNKRRKELEQQLKEQREEIAKWREKRQNARKDSTRRKYIKNRKEAKEELERLQKQIQKKKAELEEEEAEEIDEVIDRNTVDVNVSLLGVTEVIYDRGTLSLDISSPFAQTTSEVSYLPATDEFQGLACHVCEQDLTDGVLPRLCENGHLVGDPCATRCRDCGRTQCDACDTTQEFVECAICWEPLCGDCATTCDDCGEVVCGDHRDGCQDCADDVCHLCGGPCAACGDFWCDTHLTACGRCDELHCEHHLSACGDCGDLRCQAHTDSCQACGDVLCGVHATACTACGDSLCGTHRIECSHCVDANDEEPAGFCQAHATRCAIDNDIVCAEHRMPRTIGKGHICDDHSRACELCGIEYGIDALTDGQCSACQSLGEKDPERAPEAIRHKFRSVTVGANEAYIIVLGKQLLGRNKFIVYNRQDGSVHHKQNAGMFKQLLGSYT